jgi:hypothetical protein
VRVLFEIAAQDLNQFVGGFGFGGIGFRIGAQDVTFDFALDDFRHETVDRAATGGHLLQNCSAVPVLLDGVLDALQLSLNAVDARNQLFFSAGNMAQVCDDLRMGNGPVTPNQKNEQLPYTVDSIGYRRYLV